MGRLVGSAPSNPERADVCRFLRHSVTRLAAKLKMFRRGIIPLRFAHAPIGAALYPARNVVASLSRLVPDVARTGRPSPLAKTPTANLRTMGLLRKPPTLIRQPRSAPSSGKHPSGVIRQVLPQVSPFGSSMVRKTCRHRRSHGHPPAPALLLLGLSARALDVWPRAAPGRLS